MRPNSPSLDIFQYLSYYLLAALIPLERRKTKWRQANMTTVPPRVIELVETFDRNIDAYRSSQYNETQLRREFIDPFFEQLGWDVANKAGHAHAYKDVIHEDAISVGSSTKAPDYCFRIGGTRKFFLEAKKPSINIKDDPEPAYQLRRYAWSAGLPLSILTDFEEFAVYDCLSRPKQTDRASTARIMYLTYNQYLDNWSKIAAIFAREAVLKGSFDKFAASTKGKRGTTTVDVVFLAEIEKWRDMLAKIIALRNTNLSQPEINFAVQCTIDRILFLRMCEDRGIERYGQLQSISSGDRTYPRLCEIFEKADQKYNSGLFHFHLEPGRTTPPDTLTPTITIDDKDLKWILYNLYYPQCPYEFSVLPPEILGNVYEQFLGKVITLTPAHHAKIEDKPEVKKAGGVYYTPAYIVDYIVKNTVGKLINDPAANVIPSAVEESIQACHSERSEESHSSIANRKSKIENHKPLTPKQIENIKILDPACGSGSFLLGAYTYLLDYHRDWYVAHDGGKNSKKIYQGRAGHHFLTIAEKKRILLNNIFGVDIDSQAVEVTKLSLLLKVLEGENSQTLENQHRLFHERALPDLAANIKCGNSLIAPDFFDNDVIPSAAPNVIPSEVEESDKTRHCEEARPEQARTANLGDGASKQRNTQYPIRNTNNDLYQKINPFDWKIEFPQIFSRKNPGFDAVIGNPPYVFGRDWKALNIGQDVKRYLGQTYQTSPYQLDMFSIFMEKAFNLSRSGARLGQIVPNVWLTNTYSSTIRAFYLSHADQICLTVPPSDVFAGINVDTVVYTFRKSTGSSGTFQIESINRDGTVRDLGFLQVSNYIDGHRPISTAVPPASAALADRIKSNNAQLGDLAHITRGVHPYRTGGYGTTAFGSGPQTRQDVERRPYHSHVHGPGFRPFVYGRDLARYAPITPGEYVKYGSWLAEPRKPEVFEGERIYSRKILADRLVATHETTVSVADQQVYITRSKSPDIRASYLLGVLASKLISFFIRSYFDEATRVFPQIKVTQLRILPIRTIDFDNPNDKAMHDKMVNLVERMLDLHKKLAPAKIPDEKTKIQRQIDATDRQIDQLVYKLYNLTEEEIKIVEQSTDQNAHK